MVSNHDLISWLSMIVPHKCPWRQSQGTTGILLPWPCTRLLRVRIMPDSALHTTARIGIPAPLVAGKSITRAATGKFPSVAAAPAQRQLQIQNCTGIMDLPVRLRIRRSRMSKPRMVANFGKREPGP